MRQPMLQRARRMGRLVLEVEVDAPCGRQWEGHQMRVRRAPRRRPRCRQWHRVPRCDQRVVPECSSIAITPARVPDISDDEVLRAEDAFEHRAGEEVGLHRVLRPVRRERGHLPVQHGPHVDDEVLLGAWRARRGRPGVAAAAGADGSIRTAASRSARLLWREHEARHVVVGDDVGVAGSPDASPSSPTKQPAPPCCRWCMPPSSRSTHDRRPMPDRMQNSSVAGSPCSMMNEPAGNHSTRR